MNGLIQLVNACSESTVKLLVNRRCSSVAITDFERTPAYVQYFGRNKSKCKQSPTAHSIFEERFILEV